MSMIQVTFLLCMIYQVLGETTQNITASHQLIAQATHSFTVYMYDALKDQDGNIFVSPFSLEVLLTILYLGSKGAVKNEIQAALRLPNNQHTVKEGFKELIGRAENSEQLEIATKMFAASGLKIKDKFLADAQMYFYSGIDSVDYANKPHEAVTAINSFVAEKTHNKIKDLIKEVDPSTVLMLVNALYFKADWKYTFPQSRQQKFYVTSKNSVYVDMMSIHRYFNYKRDRKLGAHILEIPYRDYEYSMIIILPHKVEGLQPVESKVAESSFETITDGLKIADVKLTLPKFKLEKEIKLNDVLKRMGMTTMFVPGQANLSGIADGPLYISAAIQKTYINVDEKGTKAAAATEITVVKKSSVSIRTIDVTVNHPFMFAILRKPENSVVFLGRLVNMDK